MFGSLSLFSRCVSLELIRRARNSSCSCQNSQKQAVGPLFSQSLGVPRSERGAYFSVTGGSSRCVGPICIPLRVIHMCHAPGAGAFESSSVHWFVHMLPLLSLMILSEAKKGGADQPRPQFLLHRKPEMRSRGEGRHFEYR